MTVRIFVNHIGFLCQASKKVIVQSETPVAGFVVQDMARVASESFDADENWEVIFSGSLKKTVTRDGDFYVGDFSEITTPGVYAVVLPELKKRGTHFVVSDGSFHHLPWLFVDFLNVWRGTKETALKVRSTTDDGIRSDNKSYHSVQSGWYDAGDLRKWMTHSNLPAIGFYDLYEKLNLHRNYFHEDQLFDNDLLTVSDEAVSAILEMQDSETGKFFECLGAGGRARSDENMSWWYENHSGCLADNSDNRFTDNVLNSGDERTIRTDYNALIQYTSIYTLLRAAGFYDENFPDRRDRILNAVKNSWNNTLKEASTDPFEKRTATRSWKLMATIELQKANLIDEEIVLDAVNALLENFSPALSFWCQDDNLDDPFRGILHSAQPIISLLKFLQTGISQGLKNSIETTLISCWESYIQPLSQTSVFGYMPYGTYFKPATGNEVYTPWKNNLFYRRFMPCNSKQKINHGLNGHYTSWAHALALFGNYFENREMIEVAWNQLYWPLGFNNFNVSFVSGVGYNNPMPHSRFLGTAVGGFLIGFIGNTNDFPEVDIEAKAQWNTVEYWNTPIANSCMALAELLPKTVRKETKLGKFG